jgi:hypothetical protein
MSTKAMHNLQVHVQHDFINYATMLGRRPTT